MARVRRIAVRALLAAAAAVLAVPLLLLAYAGVAFALSWGSARGEAPLRATDIEAYVVSNGVHTDLVFPVRSPQVDWTTVFAPAHFHAMPPDAAFVAIGWGDREFFLNTPRWRDLTVGRAVGALSGTGRSLLHVTWLRNGELGTRVWRLPLDAAQYGSLIAHVRGSLADERATVIPGATYYRGTDAFFEARGAYDAFTTCNTWTGQALRRAEVPVSRWTPFAENVVAHLAPAVAVSAIPTPPP